MYHCSLLAQGEDGNALVGLLLIAGTIWFFAWLFGPKKSKGFTFQSETRGRIKPR